MCSNSARAMNLQPSPPDKTILTAAEAMELPVSAEKRGCIFYKLILQSIIQEKELGIPKKFGQKFGDKLSDVVTLIDCNLAKWKIGLRRLNHRLWFHHGWPKFVEDHSIHAGSFLIFKYEENSNFAVYIYNLTASEMKASLDSAGPSSEPAQPEKIEVASVRSPQSKDIFQTVVLPSARKTPKDKPLVKCGAEKTSSAVADSIVREMPAPKTGTRVDVDELTETHPNSKWKRRLISELDGRHNKKKPRMEVDDEKASFLKWKRRFREVTDEERRRVVLAAENFKSDVPFCRIMMRVSYVYNKFDLVLPSEFSKKYLKDIQGVIELQDPNGKKWPVRCSNKGNGTRITRGWRGFVLENNLDDGDVCIFELVQRDDIVLKVSIFRASNPEEVVQVSSESMPKSTPSKVVDNIPLERREQEVASIRSPQSKDIYRSVVLSLPSKTPTNKPFVEFGAEKTSSVVAGSNVSPDLERRDMPAARIGTRVDADELIETQPNSKWKRSLISELDGCRNKKKPRMEVHDKKASFLWKRRSGEVTDEERRRIVLAAETFKSNFPFCLIMMRASYVYYRFELSVPAEFSKKHLKGIQGVIELQDPSGRKWSVQCRKDNKGRAKLNTGWRGFVVENNLDDGDVCIFELVQRDYIVLKVSIFRASNPKVVQASSESMPKSTPSMVVDNIPLERREQDNNPAQHSGCSKDNNAFAESEAKKTSSNIADSIWKRRLISELGDCCNKKKVKTESRNKASSLRWERRPITATDEEKRQAVHAAANFTSEFPFCRMVMQPSYVYSNFNLYLPAGFSKKYLLGIRGPITLQNSNGRKWSARCRYSNYRAVITTGWREFVEDNNLDDGDVCIFELVQVEEDTFVLKVSIFRAAVIPQEEIVQVSGEFVPQKTVEGEQEVNLAQRIDIEDYANDFMEKLNKDVYAETGIRVDAQQDANNFNTYTSSEPARDEQIEVASPQSKCIYQTVILPSPSKTAKDEPFVKCHAEKTSSTVADSIVRPVLEMREKPAPEVRTRVDVNELIETQPNSKWKRRLISELDDCCNKKKVNVEARNKASSLKWKRTPRTVTDEEKIQAVHAAANFTSEFPFCRMVMQPSYVYSNFKLFLPVGFSKKYLLGIQGPITLQNSNGRKWSARCRFKKSIAIITTGWREFVVDNNLNGGDVCIFELVQVEEDTVVLKVSFFRAATIPEDEIVQLYGESVPQKIKGSEQEVNPAQRVDIEDYANDFMEKSDEDNVYTKTGIRADAQQEANSFNTGPSSEPARAEQIEVASIRSPQSKDIYQTLMLPSPSKTPKDKPFAEFSAEKTSSVTADSILKPFLELRDEPAPKIGITVDADELMETEPNNDCCDKNKPRMEVHDKKASVFKWNRRPRGVTDEERRQAVLAAENFKSDLPFCRIMMQMSDEYDRYELCLPAEFSRKHLKDIQEIIKLQDPNGRKWPVWCSYKNNRAKVTIGWHDFVAENNLDDGDVCIFELVRRNDIALNVSIFRAANPPEELVQVSSESMPENVSAMVVDDITLEGREEEVNFAQHLGTEDDFVEKLNEDFVEKLNLAGCSKDNSGFAECLANQPKSPNNIWKKRLTSELDNCCNKKKVKKKEVCDKVSSSKWKRRPRTVTDEEKIQAVHAAANFTSEFPFCRMVMQPSYVYSNLNLYLPAGFSKKYLLGIQGQITLQDSYGRKWPARCWYRKTGAIITTGWREFVVDNNLNDGDVCIFELVQVEEDIVVLKVTIFRAAAIPEEEMVQASGESMPKNVSGMVVVDIPLERREEEVNFAQCLDTKDYANGFMEKLNEDIDIIVPQNLAPGCSKDINARVEFMAEKTSSNTADTIDWPPIEMRDRPGTSIRVNADHLIETGKETITNLYLANQPNSPNRIWKRRPSSEQDCCNKEKVKKKEVRDKASSLKWKRRPKTVTDEEKRQAVYAAANFTSEFPFCQMVMQLSYVYSNFNLYLPAGFSKKYLLGIRGPITLQDSNGRKWPAQCRYSYGKSSAVITTGWREFVVDNNLDGGDVCIFELVEMEEDTVVLKVSIFRAATNPEEERVQVYGESVSQKIEGSEQEVNFAQCVDIEDYANNLMEKANEDAYTEMGTRGDAQQEANNFDLTDQPKLPDAQWKRRLTSELDDCCNKRKLKKKEARDKASSLKWKRRPGTVTDEEKIQAVHAAANFTSEFPFCRMVMQPSYVYSNFNLYLPADFSKKYLLGIQGPITLQDSNGRKWPAQCRYRYKNTSAIITKGWREFVVDNNLDGGDVCIFELVQMEEIVLLKVSIFRAATNPEEEIVQDYGESVPQKIEGSEEEVNLAQRVDIEDYANDFMEKATEDAYAEMGTRGDAQQEANNFYLADQPTLSDSEWKRRLTSEPDECRNKKEAEIKVRDKASSLKWKRRSREVTDEEKRLAVHAAANFKSKFPFCRMVMSPSYVHYNFVLHLPAGFSKKHLKDIRVITLRDPNGREWLPRLSKSRRSIVMLRKGWREFVVDNNLDDGDVCIFELVQKEDDTVVLKVSIFRAAKPEEVVQ